MTFFFLQFFLFFSTMWNPWHPIDIFYQLEFYISPIFRTKNQEYFFFWKFFFLYEIWLIFSVEVQISSVSQWKFKAIFFNKAKKMTIFMNLFSHFYQFRFERRNFSQKLSQEYKKFHTMDEKKKKFVRLLFNVSG